MKKDTSDSKFSEVARGICAKIEATGFKIDRKSITGHDSCLFQSIRKDGVAAIDIHRSGRLTVMRAENGLFRIHGFDMDEVEAAVTTLVSGT